MLKVARGTRFLPGFGRLSLVFGTALSLVVACSGDDDDSNGGKQDNTAGEAGGGKGGTSSAGKGGKAGSAQGGSSAAKGGSSSLGGESGEGGKGGAGGADSTSGLHFPLTLTPIGTPLTTTAHVSLYFTATDADSEPVPGLETDQFIAKEDKTDLDRFESAFRVTNPKGALVIPTVLLLDLSRSVVQAGALDDLKKAANRIIDNLDKSQRLAIVSFATDTLVRQTFTTDKALLHATIDAITKADGVSTNLYGALVSGYNLWEDGFRPYDPGVVDPQLVAGLMVAISDGSDTAAISTLNQVLTARGTKRTIFIRVGEEVDAKVPGEIANAGVITAKRGFGDLDSAVDATTERIAKLNGAIYAAEYCSPKRAGSHELVFTVKGNESYVSTTGTADCSTTDLHLNCDYCSSNAPYACNEGSEPTCYTTPKAAYSACGVKCIACNALTDTSGALSGGPSIDVSFSASAFQDAQCDDLFTDPTPPSGNGGAGGESATGTGGTGGTVGAGGTSGEGACEALSSLLEDQCGQLVTSVTTSTYEVALPKDCQRPQDFCAGLYDEVLSCFTEQSADIYCLSPQKAALIAVCDEAVSAYVNCSLP